MAARAARQPYRTDQRELSVYIYAHPKGGTEWVATWRECLAGEDTKRETTLARGHWDATLNEWGQTPRAVLWIANALRDLQMKREQ